MYIYIFSITELFKGYPEVNVLSCLGIIIFLIYMYIYLKSKKTKKLNNKKDNEKIKITKQKNVVYYAQDKRCNNTELPNSNNTQISIDEIHTVKPTNNNNNNTQNAVENHTTVIPNNNNNNNTQSAVENHTTIIPVNNSNNNTQNTVEDEYDTALANKINKENIFNAECIDTIYNYNNYIMYPLPSYEILDQNLNNENIQPSNNDIANITNPVVPVRESFFTYTNNIQTFIFDEK